MLGFLARMFLARRLFGDRSRRGGYGYGYPYASRRRSGGFRWLGPMPTYSGRTRRGTRVSVGGCCLPIPLALGVGLVSALRLLRRA